MLDSIRNQQGEALDFAHTEGRDPQRIPVVIGHGVTANKDRAWAVTLDEALARAGHTVTRFSFSGNGGSQGEFGESTISKEVQDLGAVFDALGAGDDRPVCYVGHSMGGAVGVLRAAEDARIGRLVSLAGMVHTADFAERKFGESTPGRDVMWDKPNCPLSQTFVDDMNHIGSVITRAPAIQVPWLLVHGTDDTVVPPGETKEIAGAAGGQVAVVMLNGADHLFSGEHEQSMARTVVAWLERMG